MLKYYVAVVVGLMVPAGLEASQRTGFSFKTGFGYDFLSQQYFVDSIRLSEDDTVLTRWSLTNDYLDDFKGSFQFAYRYDGARTVELRSSYEQTPELIRLKFNSDWDEETIFGNLRWRSQIDWRDQYRSATSPLGSYISGSTTARLKYPVTISTSIWGQAQGELTDFYSVDRYGYDHVRYGGKAGLEQAFGLLSMATLNGFYLTRQVADSQTLDYTSYGVEGSFSGSFERFDLDFLGRWESKDYNRPGMENDYKRFDIDALSRIEMGQGFISRQRFEMELTSFDPLDPLNSSYDRFGLTFLGGMEFGGLEFGVGPSVELLQENVSDTSFAEDYFESAGMLDLSYLSSNGIFASLESRLGYRQLEYINEYQSNFVFYELSLVADWTVWQTVNLNLLLSTEWEWHDEQGSDNRVVLLSTGVSYAF